MDDLTFKKEAKKLKSVLEKLKEENDYLNETLVSNANIYSKEDYTRAHLIYMGEKRLKEIEKTKSKPYFARLDFREKENTAFDDTLSNLRKKGDVCSPYDVISIIYWNYGTKTDHFFR